MNNQNKRPIIALTGSYTSSGDQFYLKRSYIDAIRLAGGIPVIINPIMDVPKEWSGDAAKWLEAYDLEAEVLDRIDGILFTGGDDVGPAFYNEPVLRVNGEIVPQRDAFEIKLVQEAIKRDIPCFGICRGIQAMAVGCGAKLCQDVYTGTDANGDKVVNQHGQKAPSWYPSHTVTTEEGSKLRSILGACAGVNSFHHQCVKQSESYPFVVTAHSDDGIIEGIEKPELTYFVAVQWHPERMMQDPKQRGLFETFVQYAAGNKVLDK